MDYPGRLITGLVCVIIFLLFPLQYIAQSGSEDIDALVCNETKALADDIRKKGYIDQAMYEEYIDFLHQTGELYELEIEDIHPVVGDAAVSINGIDTLTNLSITNKLAGRYTYYTEPDNASNNLIRISSSDTHVHTEACYAGHRHNESTCDYINYFTGPPIQFKGAQTFYDYNQYGERLITKNVMCQRCNNVIGGVTLNDYENDSIYYRYNNNGDYLMYSYMYLDATNKVVLVQGQSISMFLTSNYDDGTGWTEVSENYYRKINPEWSTYYNHFSVLIRSSDEVVLEHWLFFGYKMEYSCPFCMKYGYISKTLASMWSCGQVQDETPVCNQVVTNITATNPYQEVVQGQNIITTANATYLDGHTGIVNCSAYGYKPNALGNQTVTLTYSGLINNARTNGELSCTVNVLVKPARTLTSITVTPSVQTVERYSKPVFTVKAYYSDGTNAVIDSGKYTISGYNSAKLGTQTVTVSYTEMGVTKSATSSVNVTVLKRECPICHNIYDLLPDDSDPGCPFCRELITGITVSPNYLDLNQGDYLAVTVEAIYRNGSKGVVYGWTSNYNPDLIGIQNVTIEYGGFAAAITVNVKERVITCPVCGTKYPASEGECPSCREKVIAISVEPGSVTVRQHENIDITVTAFFANGSSRIVEDWSIDCITARPGSYKATVTYRSVSATIDLTVLSVTDEQCPICGLIFDKVEYPNGCPVCFTTLTGIEAYLLSEGNKVQYGAIPDIAVVLIFRDEHREMITDGYVLENYNPFVLGIQTVTVKYGGFSTTLILELVNTLTIVTCPKGHVYYLNEDGTDPGCPYCRLEGSYGTVRIYDIRYTTDILDELYDKGIYQFKRGNLITIRLVKKDKSLLYKLQKMFFKTSLPGRRKSFIFGGEVF